MADIAEKVQQIISKAHQEIKSIEVVKEIQLEYDIGNLLVTDKNTLDENLLRNDDAAGDDYLRSIARDGIQALLTQVWDLPAQRIDSAIYATLPKPTTRLPREKPVPKAKALTKWEQYAREKGLTRKKKDKKQWDEDLKRWVPRYGYRKVEAEKEKHWVKEVPANADPYEDQFAKVAEMKRENIAKNEFQRLRNIAKHKKIKVPKVGVTGNDMPSKRDLDMAMHHSKHATASLGKFQPPIAGEKKIKGLGKKRKHEEVTGDAQAEKKRYMEVLDKMDKPNLNLDAAIHKQIRDENVAMEEKKKGGKKYLRRSKMGKRHRTKSDYRAMNLGKGIHKQTKAKNKSKAAGAKGRALAKTGGTVSFESGGKGGKGGKMGGRGGKGKGGGRGKGK